MEHADTELLGWKSARVSYQSTHSILTVSPSLMVPAKGTNTRDSVLAGVEKTASPPISTAPFNFRWRGGKAYYLGAIDSNSMMSRRARNWKRT